MQLFGFSVFRPIQVQKLKRRIEINKQIRPEIKNIQPTVVLIVRLMNIKCFILKKTSNIAITFYHYRLPWTPDEGI